MMRDDITTGACSGCSITCSSHRSNRRDICEDGYHVISAGLKLETLASYHSVNQSDGDFLVDCGYSSCRTLTRRGTDSCGGRHFGPGVCKYNSQGKTRTFCQPALGISNVIMGAVVLSLVTGVCSASYKNGTDSSSNYSSGGYGSSFQHRVAGKNYRFTNMRNLNTTDSSNHRRAHSSGDTDYDHVVLPKLPVSESDDHTNPGVADSEKPAKNIIGEPDYLSGTISQPASQEGEDNDSNSKIIGMVVPFVCVIVLAVILCLTWKLCRKYKLCNNETCLEKCSLFCNNCMSAPLVFQVPEQVKLQGQVSRTTTTSSMPIYKHSRSFASPSNVSLTTASIGRQPQSRSNVPRRKHDTVRTSRHSHSPASHQRPSGSAHHPSMSYAPVGQQNLVHAVTA